MRKKIAQLAKLFVHRNLILVEVAAHVVHQILETPERFGFVLNDKQNNRKKIVHALHVADIAVEERVSEQDVVEQHEVRIVVSCKEIQRAIRPNNILLNLMLAIAEFAAMRLLLSIDRGPLSFEHQVVIAAQR
jgi:hypothetical protein